MNIFFRNVTQYVLMLAAVALPVLGARSASAWSGGTGAEGWVAAWQGSSTAGTRPDSATCPEYSGLAAETIRNVVFVSAGGDQVRVRVSNAGGVAPLEVSAATVAVSAGGSAIVAGTLRPLTFSGQTATVIASGSEALSDPVSLTVKALESLAVSVYFAGRTGYPTLHLLATGSNYVSAGNQADATGFSAASQAISCWMFVSGVDVKASSQVMGALVTLGDSITDGFQSTLNANHRYPDDLARQLAARTGSTLSVSNAGLGGNTLFANRIGSLGPLYGNPAAARFARDVLTQAGVKAVILLEGINDIGANSADAADLIQVDQQIIAQAHAAGLKIYGATLTPFLGCNRSYGFSYGTAAGDTQRLALNQWIRTSGAFDGVFDFDQAVRDPNNTSHLLASYDSGDHLHLSDAGYLKLSQTVNLDTIVAAVEAEGVE